MRHLFQLFFRLSPLSSDSLGWRVSDAGTPERAEDGVDDSGQDFERWQVAMKSGDDAFADGSDVFEDAARECEVGEPVWERSWERTGGTIRMGGLADSVDDEVCEVCQLFCFTAKDVLRYGVSLRGALHHCGSEAGEVRRGNLVGVTDERVEIGELPQVEDGR